MTKQHCSSDKDVPIDEIAEELTINLGEYFFDILKKMISKYPYLKKLKKNDTVNLMMYPLSMVVANNISAIMHSKPREEWAELSMRLLSHHQQLVEKVVNDNFVILAEKEAKSNGKQNH